jgi:hypothetical protein
MSSSRLIDFERADVITPMIYPPQPRLVVTGTKPHPDVEVTLVPLVYVSQPSHLGIQVVATTTHDGPHVSQPIANVPFAVELDLRGCNGSQGVEVIGETGTEKIAVPAGEPQAATQPAAE